LAANAERNRELLEFYRYELKKADDSDVKKSLKEVIEGAERYEAEKVRKTALAALEARKAGGPVSKSWNFAAEVGSTTLSIGCVVAGAMGQPAIAAPCVVAGALYSGAVHLWKTPR
jgi:hypothetical protein